MQKQSFYYLIVTVKLINSPTCRIIRLKTNKIYLLLGRGLQETF